MKLFVIVIVLVLVAVTTSAKQKKCRNGKVWVECASACTPTCDDPNPVCTEECRPARCQCPSDKPIKKGKKCVEEAKCTACKKSTGKVWNQCGKACTPTCDDPIPRCTKNCVPRCECPADKPLMKGSKCIAQSQCTECNKNSGEVWNECGSRCTPTCDNPNPICADVCTARCECPADKPLKKGNKCVETTKCPK